jgi:predicted acylesterase/phospholipase RssA
VGSERDVAIVLSGGGVNGVLLELGFLQRLRDSELWPRVGWIFGTSAGALAGTMAALGRIDELERFMLALRPEQTFRPNRLWQLPLVGMMDYALPRTAEEHFGDLVALARTLAAGEIEVVALATDVTDDHEATEHYELAYSSKHTPPEVMAHAVMASAAISALVLPLRVGDRIATDGSWVRNYPLGYAYDHPEVELIVSFRYLPRYPRIDPGWLAAMRRRIDRFPKVPPVRALVDELRDAEARAQRGEPAHLAEMIVRLARVAIARNTVLEERSAGEKDRSIAELAALRAEVTALVHEHIRPGRRRGALLEAIEERFDAARFPFRHDRQVPRITVRGAAGELSLDQSFRNQQPWTEQAKRDLIRRGYELTDEELRSAGYA